MYATNTRTKAEEAKGDRFVVYKLNINLSPFRFVAAKPVGSINATRRVV
jgi:hypothetical protein